ncbi:MAG: carboxypeptidase regulatory-like domain-containing protein [Terriglobales bacterium]
MLNLNSPQCSAPRFAILAALALLAMTAVIASSVTLFAQTTISTGSIQGTVIDQTGAVVGGVQVTITQKSTGRVIDTTTTSSGTYASGALTPGEYTVRVEAPGFKTTEATLTVEVGVTATGNLKLQVGEASQVVEVQGDALQVNTEQASVQGVVNTEQIENLPINGRNFLDLAQLEPGVQIQDGGDFDPTKKGFASISFGGRFGRTARIEVDGLDISDETVGTTTQDIPQGAIQEFQIGESMLDLSTELTSSGAVNVTTKSGTNAYHGAAYYYFRDQDLDADLPGGSDSYLQRNQFGGNFGGALLQNKLFFFTDAERTKQGFVQPVLAGYPFQADTGGFDAPFKEGELVERLDWQITQKYKMFYRFSYNKNDDVGAFVANSFQPMDNVTYTHDHAVGLDFNTGSFTHSFRFGYMKFYNHIASGVTSSTPFNPTSPIELAIGSDPFCIGDAPVSFCSGQPFLAPQATLQSNHQIKYDGGKPVGSHILRYGGGFNHIQGGSFDGMLANGPAVNAPTTGVTLTCGASCLTGGLANPLNYPALNVILANGQGYPSEKPAFGFPAGGLGPDNRFSFYIGDSWKLKPNLTLTYGLRYVRDTGRTDSDLGPIAALDQFNNQFFSGLGNRVNNPNKNFGPQLGVAWDPAKNGKTVFRGGIGLFYENSLWNNEIFDRRARIQEGSFLAFTTACANGQSTGPLPFPTSINLNAICGQPIFQVESQIATLEQEYTASAKATSGLQPNPSFIGSLLMDTGPDGTGDNLFAPNFRDPRSVQMNFGVQREIRKGMVLSADYLRNVSTHSLLTIDTNHVGDARFLNVANATAAINATNAALGCGTGAAGINCAIANGATISSYAGNGLDSGYTFGGLPCPTCAFPGINPNLGGNQMMFPIGRSVYNGLQMSWKQDVHNPVKGIPYMNLQASYSLSKYAAMAQDSDFVNSARDPDHPTKYMGPNGLDRTHQISFGGTMELPAHFKASLIGHFYSPLAQNLTLAPTGAPGGIFVTDVLGAGTGDGNDANGSNGPLGSLLPGTNFGSFGRSVNPGNINKVISNYNNTYAGNPTPAGQALITAGLFTQGQLVALGGVMPQVSPAPANEAGNAWLRDFDLNFGWTYKIKEKVELEPGVGFFNVMNFVNFDGTKNTLSGVLSLANQTPVVGTANGTPGEQPASNRIGTGSGVFGLGSPRVVEFTLKLSF